MQEMPSSRAVPSDETLVRGYLTALNSGRVVDALNSFSMDACLRDETGRERRGIREIAAAFAHSGRPVKIEIEELTREGDTVAVRIRMSDPQSRSPQSYRSVFRIRRNRIQSLVINPLPAKGSRRTRFAIRA